MLRIPFAGGARAKGRLKSKYIQAPISFFQAQRAENAVSAAFATVTSKKDGRPTKAHFCSQNGSRTGFLNYSLKNIEQRIYERLSIDIYKYIQFQING